MVAEEKANEEKNVKEMFEEMLAGFYRVEKEVNRKYDNLDKKVDKLDGKVDKLDKKVNYLDEKVENLDKKVDKNSRKLTDIGRDIKIYKKLTLQHGLDIEFLKDKVGEDKVF